MLAGQAGRGGRRAFHAARDFFPRSLPRPFPCAGRIERRPLSGAGTCRSSNPPPAPWAAARPPRCRCPPSWRPLAQPRPWPSASAPLPCRRSSCGRWRSSSAGRGRTSASSTRCPPSAWPWAASSGGACPTVSPLASSSPSAPRQWLRRSASSRSRSRSGTSMPRAWCSAASASPASMRRFFPSRRSGSNAVAASPWASSPRAARSVRV